MGIRRMSNKEITELTALFLLLTIRELCRDRVAQQRCDNKGGGRSHFPRFLFCNDRAQSAPWPGRNPRSPPPGGGGPDHRPAAERGPRPPARSPPHPQEAAPDEPLSVSLRLAPHARERLPRPALTLPLLSAAGGRPAAAPQSPLSAGSQGGRPGTPPRRRARSGGSARRIPAAGSGERWRQRPVSGPARRGPASNPGLTHAPDAPPREAPPPARSSSLTSSSDVKLHVTGPNGRNERPRLSHRVWAGQGTRTRSNP